MTNLYTLKITDTFGGEANYCWVRRAVIRAKSERGAVLKAGRFYGYHWRADYDGRYNAKGAAVCMFVDLVDSADAETYVRNYSHFDLIGV